jgi:ribosomal protein L37AE/L43A
MCLNAGYSARFEPDAIRGTWHVSYTDSIAFGEPTLYSDGDIKRVSYTGRTWCVNMPSGFIVARRALVKDGVVVQASVPIILGNCIVSHGATEFLKEIMMEKSDNFQVYVCKSCGLLGQVNPKAGIYKCSACENSTDFAQVRVPYAYKLFLQELESMAISSRLLPESRLRQISRETALIAAANTK